MTMNQATKSYIYSLLQLASTEIEQGRFDEAWNLLEEAHIVSQPSALMHTIVHWRMLKLGMGQRSIQEVWGQLIRLLLAAPGSLSGKYPLGNTGRSHVNMFLPISIPDKIAEKMRTLGAME
jgi:hypothetical protein